MSDNVRTFAKALAPMAAASFFINPFRVLNPERVNKEDIANSGK